MVTVTSLEVFAFGQGPFAMDHRYTFTPKPAPVTVVVGLEAFAKVPDPLTTDHTPIAGAVAALPASVRLRTGAHRFWAGPALAAAALRSNTRITTSSVVVFGTHGPLLMVHRSVVVPTGMLVTAVVGEPGVVIVADPFTTVHVPVPGAVGVFPAMVVLAKTVLGFVQRS